MRRGIPRFNPEGGPKNQIRGMRANFPGFSYRVRRGGLIWTGTLQPTEESPSYEIQIDHELGRSPKVFVMDPAPRHVVHRYRDGSLCLYWPKEWRWHGQRSLAETIVPWAALWLYHYEIWQVCGTWMGPEAPHGDSKTQPV
jgi:hypothetical protein